MISERRVTRRGAAWVEVSREGVPTVYLLTPAVAEDCAQIRNEDSRWRCCRLGAFAQKSTKEER